jgi:hypothetical protein
MLENSNLPFSVMVPSRAEGRLKLANLVSLTRNGARPRGGALRSLCVRRRPS